VQGMADHVLGEIEPGVGVLPFGVVPSHQEILPFLHSAAPHVPISRLNQAESNEQMGYALVERGRPLGTTASTCKRTEAEQRHQPTPPTPDIDISNAQPSGGIFLVLTGIPFWLYPRAANLSAHLMHRER
jgi:hypothetical protein